MLLDVSTLKPISTNKIVFFVFITVLLKPLFKKILSFYMSHEKVNNLISKTKLIISLFNTVTVLNYMLSANSIFSSYSYLLMDLVVMKKGTSTGLFKSNKQLVLLLFFLFMKFGRVFAVESKEKEIVEVKAPKVEEGLAFECYKCKAIEKLFGLSCCGLICCEGCAVFKLDLGLCAGCERKIERDSLIRIVV